ncbi:anti-sigma factor domain-containing protein [Actinomadura rugatobispora]|uniref:Regulator of SigK n=1 Tax=Actinomadura rugatobispora TaxID=1994 RepID=A0ABW0ZTW9_9ACTN|nr:anti-sigma factor [Actinomadura rugatobispora]
MTQDPHLLAAAYALDALSDTERRRFRRHLDGCATCAEEVGGLRETTARLAVAATRRPPDSLHRDVLEEIAHTRQLPPRIARGLPRARARGAGWVLAAACLVLALISGTAAVQQYREADRARAFDRQVTAVLTAPDARTATARPGGAGTLTVVASRSLDKAVVAASRLRALPKNETYQLWYLGRAAPRSAGTLPPPASQGRRPFIAEGLADARTIAVTVEPAGGSSQPTGAPFLTVPLG